MPKTRDNYQISAGDITGLVPRLNFILSRISDRLDKLEGIRDEMETASGTFTGDVTTKGDVKVTDTNSNTLHSME